VNKLHWTYDSAERAAARAEILEFLRRNGESRTAEIAQLPHFRDDPLVIVLRFLEFLEKAGIVESRRFWFEEHHKGDERKPSYFTWQLTGAHPQRDQAQF
jgi:hypothetical protein